MRSVIQNRLQVVLVVRLSFLNHSFLRGKEGSSPTSCAQVKISTSSEFLCSQPAFALRDSLSWRTFGSLIPPNAPALLTGALDRETYTVLCYRP